MARPKADRRKRQECAKTRNQKKTQASYNDYGSSSGVKKLQKAVSAYTGNVSKTAKQHDIPKTTLHRELKKLEKCDVNSFILNRSERLVLLGKEEEVCVEKYCLWQGDRGMNLTNANVKALIQEIHTKAVEGGSKRQPITKASGPSLVTA